MNAILSGRLRPHGACGLSIDKGARCEIGFADLILSLSDHQARSIRDGLVALYGPPAALQRQLQCRPARRLAEDALPPEATVVLHTLSEGWIDTDALSLRLAQPLAPADLRRLLYMLYNAGKIERRITPLSARRGNYVEWRRN